MKKEIQTWIHGLSGKLIGIGIQEEEILNWILKNENITECNLLESISKEEGKKRGKKKYLSVKKMRKKFKKKQNDFLLMNYEVIAPYLKHVIKDSIYITKKEIMIYGISYENVTLLQKRYRRYDIKIRKKNISNIYILFINVENAKNSFWKDFFYSISDTIYNTMELISNFLIQ